MNLTDKQAQLVAKIDQLLPQARPSWWPANDPARLYLSTGRKDAKVFLEFDDPAEVSGAAVKISLDSGAQSPAWVAAQKKRLMEWAAPAFYAALLVGRGDAEAALFLAELAETNPALHEDITETLTEA